MLKEGQTIWTYLKVCKVENAQTRLKYFICGCYSSFATLAIRKGNFPTKIDDIPTANSSAKFPQPEIKTDSSSYDLLLALAGDAMQMGCTVLLNFIGLLIFSNAIWYKYSYLNRSDDETQQKDSELWEWSSNTYRYHYQAVCMRISDGQQYVQIRFHKHCQRQRWLRYHCLCFCF